MPGSISARGPPRHRRLAIGTVTSRDRSVDSSGSRSARGSGDSTSARSKKWTSPISGAGVAILRRRGASESQTGAAAPRRTWRQPSARATHQSMRHRAIEAENYKMFVRLQGVKTSIPPPVATGTGSGHAHARAQARGLKLASTRGTGEGMSPGRRFGGEPDP